jgi:heterodisulfide reductase subunit A
MEEPRVGVFVCHCGSNIAGFLDVGVLTDYARTLPHVVVAQDNLYTCSDGGRAEIQNAIADHNLNRVVVASCTPRTHEPLFRATCRDAGLNPYLFELVNIRDQCSWVHMGAGHAAMDKARDLLRMGIARAALLEPGEDIEVGVLSRALVIGGGVAGLTAALNLADRGFQVTLVERESELGGLLQTVHTLYPTGRDAKSFIQEKIDAALAHPRIAVLTQAHVSDVSGYVGNYKVVVSQEDGTETALEVGAIIVAVGAREFRPSGLYGYDGQRVITQGELERLLVTKAAQPDRRLGSVVMIQCVGARDEQRPYCSRICCTTAVKNALAIRELDPENRVYVLYRDMLTLGTEHERMYREARGRGVTFLEYSPESPPAVRDGEVTIFDELLGQELAIPSDLVVLSTPLVGQRDAVSLAQMLKVPIDEHGFFLEAHVKLRPLDFATDGIFLCGSAHWPCDVGESVIQAQGAAARASILLGKQVVQVEPIVSVVDEAACIGCGLCESACPYNAIVLVDTGSGRKARTIAASCKGCGVCGAGCIAEAITMQHFSNRQLRAQIDALVEMAV